MKGMVIRNEQNKTHREHERITAGPDFPAFRSGRLIRISREAFFEWMARNRIVEPIRKDE